MHTIAGTYADDEELFINDYNVMSEQDGLSRRAIYIYIYYIQLWLQSDD